MRFFALLLLGCLAAISLSLRVKERQIRLEMPSMRRLHELARGQLEVITPKYGPALVFHVGTPPQKQRLAIDTTSGDTWLVDIHADQPQSEPWDFKPEKSTTFKNHSVLYASDVVDLNGLPAKIAGAIADDVFTAFDSFRMRFALIESVRQLNWSAEVPDLQTQGIVGFGFFASNRLMTPFLPTLLSNFTQKSISTSLYECMPSENNLEILGNVTLGYMDEVYCNTTTTVTLPLSDRSSWNFAIDGYTIGSLTSNKRQMATIDTRETLTGVPKDVYDYVYKLANASTDPYHAWPVVDCNGTYPELHFNLGGDDLSLPPHLYIYEPYKQLENAGFKCHLMLYPLSGGGFRPSWSFGYILMYKKCVTFDVGHRQMSFTDYNHGICDRQFPKL